MTESSEPAESKSEFYERVFDEDYALFLADRELAELPDVNPDRLADTVDATHNTQRHNLRALAVLGGAAIACTVVIVSFSGPSKSPPKHHSRVEQTVRLNGLPKRLPAAVRADLNNVGRVNVEVYPSQDVAATSDDYQTEQWGSAVELRPGLVITAGHVFNGPYNQTSSSEECQQVTFSSSLQRDFLVNEYGTTSNNPMPSIPDLEVISLPPSPYYQTDYDSIRNIAIAQTPPKMGEKLFFVNEEPLINRNRSSIYGYTRQSIYVGVYDGETSYGDYDVITGLKSYGQISNNSSIGGASGGAVFNAKGQLVGISVRASDNSANNEIVSSSSIKQYGNWDRVTFTGLKPNRKVSDSIIQPVTKSLMEQYVSRGHIIPQNCFPEGGEE